MSNDSVPDIIETPASNDVLCGQDATYGQHPGNALLRQQLQEALGDYQLATDRRDKIVLIDNIITYMRETHNTRFVRLSDERRGCWTTVSEQSVRDKVSHALRFAARRQQKQSSKGNKEETKTRPFKKPTMTKSKKRKSIKMSSSPTQ